MKFKDFVKGFFGIVLLMFLIGIVAGDGLSFLMVNQYIQDFSVYIFPVIVSLWLSAYFFLKGKKNLAIGIFSGFLIYYLFYLFAIFWAIGESTCSRYFFNLFSNC